MKYLFIRAFVNFFILLGVFFIIFLYAELLFPEWQNQPLFWFIDIDDISDFLVLFFAGLMVVLPFFEFVKDLMWLNDQAQRLGVPRDWVAKAKFYHHLDVDAMKRDQFKIRYDRMGEKESKKS